MTTPPLSPQVKMTPDAIRHAMGVEFLPSKPLTPHPEKGQFRVKALIFYQILKILVLT